MADERRKLLRRIDVVGTARFLTFSCYRRLPLLNNDDTKARFVESFRLAAERFEMSILAWVIMPEHVHLLVFQADNHPLTPFLTALKRPLATQMIGQWRKSNAAVLNRITDKKGDARFWLPGGGYDRNVAGKELIEKIRYVHSNPVTRELAANTLDWAWSSARQYADRHDAIGPPITKELVPDHSGELY